jgi:vacuolar-type H+-ATPase subunit I/STV1
MSFYEMRAKTLSVFVANTQKVLKEAERKEKAEGQAERIENFVKDITMRVNNMLTKFHWLKERKNRKQEPMTNAQTKALVDFANFVKTLAQNVQSLLKRFQKSQTFEEKLDKEMKELETHVRQKLKEFDEAMSETPDTLINRLNKYAGNIAAGIRGRLKALAWVWYRRMWIRENMRTTQTFDSKINLDISSSLTKPLADSIKEDSLRESIDPRDSELEAFFDRPSMIDINEANSNSEKSECQIQLKV